VKVDYDSSGDTIQLVLEPIDRLQRDDADIAGVIVGICDERPMMVDLIGTSTGIDRRLEVVGKRYRLDTEALTAAAHAALAAPDRTIIIDGPVAPTGRPRSDILRLDVRIPAPQLTRDRVS
jgi:hypothetical protein